MQLKPTGLAFAAMILTTSGALADPIRSACLASDRGRCNVRLCACIQAAADAALSRTDQRRAATFFATPQEAQNTKTSSNPSDLAFWARYEKFGAFAEQQCRKL